MLRQILTLGIIFVIVNVCHTADIIIDTDIPTVSRDGTALLNGSLEDRTFTCLNNKTWKMKFASFSLQDHHLDIFSSRNTIHLKGSNPLKIRAKGNLIVNTTIDMSGVSLNISSFRNHLGGFGLSTTNCCFVGAGPGAGFTYHGGGYGGNGGGAWKDVTNDYIYGRGYPFLEEVAGGSTGAIVYDSDPGTGGGAISIYVNGIFILGCHGRIIANGYNVKNTSYPACSGGSSGGKIILAANKVVLEGELSAIGGSSGKTSNYSDYCGDGGGGGIIVLKSFDYALKQSFLINVEGGKGLENGTNGVIKRTVKSTTDIVINTTSCVMTINGSSANNYLKIGQLTTQGKIFGCRQFYWQICTFTFQYDVKFSDSVKLFGDHALKIVSVNGDIEVSTKLDVTARGKTGSGKMQKTILGGFHNHPNAYKAGPGSDVNGAAHGHVNNSKSYGIEQTYLIGGSSCQNDSLKAAYGGGALALEAEKGTIRINANISADAYSDNPEESCGASGGTVILLAKNVTINAFVTADGSDGKSRGGDGGVIATVARNPNVLVRPGKCKGNSGGDGKAGTVKVPGIGLSVVPASCISSTPAMTSLQTTEVLSPSIPSQTKVSPASSINLSKQHANSSQQTRFTITEKTSLAVGIKTITATLMSEAYTTTASEHYSPMVSVTPSSSYRWIQSTSISVNKNRISKQILPFVNRKVNSSSALRMSGELAEAVTSAKELTREDTHVVMTVLDQFANASIYVPKDLGECRNVTRNVMKSCAKLATSSFQRESRHNNSVDLVPKITRTLENLGGVIGGVLKENQTFLLEDDVLTIEVTSLGSTTVDQSFPSSQKARNRDDLVNIPKEIFLSVAGPMDVIFVQMNTNSTYKRSRDRNGSDVQTLSNIVAIKLSSGDLSSLVKPITIRQKLIREPQEGQIVQGGFWKAVSGDSSGGWSYEGCSTTRNGEVVETKSNHMTSFAVLMSFRKEKIPDHHAKTLSFITYIGCGISLFCLLLTFATFVTLDSLDPERTAIHTNLVVALGIAQVVFLAGIKATENKAACTAVAVLLHYFFTAAFAWMFAEGVHLYKKVVSVFSHGSKLKFYYVIGWGLPVIIVALSTGIRPDGYGTESSCWISLDGGLIWAFVAPVIIVIIINFVVLFIVVKILMSSVSTVQVDSKTSQETNRSTQQIKAGAKAMIILMPILGLSWVFGLLAVNEATLVFQYLFCIFNSMQGLFIFLIHCVGNSEVRAAFKRLHEKHTVSKSFGERSFAKSVSKKSKSGSGGAEILVRRETPTSHDGERSVTPKTLSAGQISLNSLNTPTYDNYYTEDEH